MPDKSKTVYLTFDDGPHPAATPFVLEQLQQYNTKGTFFCIGKNVAEHPTIYQQLLAEGHAVGNHTMHHLNGWETKNAIYLNDIEEAEKWIDSSLFRPPYGRIKRSQIREFKNPKSKVQTHKPQIILWSVLSGDFDTEIDGEKCFQNVVKNIQSGSIIVFHDSAKALPHLQYTLPKVLQWLQENGYQAKAIRL